MTSRTNSLQDADRRVFLSHAARTFLGLGALPLLSPGVFAGSRALPPRTGRAPAKNVIYLFMAGGMTHLDTFDPKPGAATQGPTESIDTSAQDVRISSHLPNLARLMDRCVVVSSMNSTQGAHEQGQYFMHTSYVPRGTIQHASLGSWVLKSAGMRNPTLPGYVTVGGTRASGSGWMPTQFAPLPIGDPDAGLAHCECASDVDPERLRKRLARLEEANARFAGQGGAGAAAYGEMYDQAVKLMGSRDLEAFDLSKEKPALREAYGDDRFGQGCLLARRLVEHGVRFVEVVHGGWDTHNDNFGEMEEKLPPLDRTVATLLLDLEARGLLDETLVVIATEFGRTPDIVENRENGRNHYPKAFSCVLAGGGIRGGRRYGRTCAEGREIVDSPVSIPDFNATIAYALGLPFDEVVTTSAGRPFTLADKGRPLTELF